MPYAVRAMLVIVIAILGTTFVRAEQPFDSPPGSFKIERADESTKVSIIMRLSDEDDEDNFQATFDFKVRGRDELRSPDGTIFVVNGTPVRGLCFVHIGLKFQNGDLMYINNVNERVARFLKGQAAQLAKGYLYAEAISGRKISMKVIEAYSHRAPQYHFAVGIGERGELYLASRVRVELPHPD
jgi:hypothetical protein